MNAETKMIDEVALRPANGALRVNRRWIPDVPVLTHRGEKRAFYSDLVRDRIVLIHFMSIAHHRRYPVMPNLAALQDHLRHRAAAAFSFISVTAEPEQDDAEHLAVFADALGVALPSWHLVTGHPDDMALLKATLFVHRGPELSPEAVSRKEAFELWRSQLGETDPARFCAQPGDAGRDCSMGLMRYGNEPLCLWGSTPARANPAQIAARLDWIDPARHPSSARGPRRGGPHLPA
jgi:protein SCO1/2